VYAGRFATFEVRFAGRSYAIGRLNLAQLQRIEMCIWELARLEGAETIEAIERKQEFVANVLIIATRLDVLDIPGVTNAEVAVAFKNVLDEAGFKPREGHAETSEPVGKSDPAKFWRKLYGRLIAAGIPPSAIDAFSMWDVEALYEHWGEAPPANEILAAVHLEKPKAKGPTDGEKAIMEKYKSSAPKVAGADDDPSGIGGLVANTVSGQPLRMSDLF
jgi:hypothetical protein